MSRRGTSERSPTPEHSLVLEVRNSKKKQKGDGLMHMCNEVGCHTGVSVSNLPSCFELSQIQLEIRRNFTNSVSEQRC